MPDNEVTADDVEVVRLSDCIVRYQNPNDTARGGDPQHPERSKFSQTNFGHTQEGVDATIGSYNNTSGNNIPLFLSGDTGLWYSGLRRDPHVRMVPQERLNEEDTIVTIFFPSSGLERVHPSSSGPANTPYGTVPAFGLTGTLAPQHRHWTTVRNLVDSYNNATVQGLNAPGHMEVRLEEGRQPGVDAEGFPLFPGRRLIIDLRH